MSDKQKNKEMNDRFLVQQYFQKRTGYAQSNGKITLNSELYRMGMQAAVAHFRPISHDLP
jgi:hypothetical protein